MMAQPAPQVMQKENVQLIDFDALIANQQPREKPLIPSSEDHLGKLGAFYEEKPAQALEEKPFDFNNIK